MEACSSAHHWARQLVQMGHQVRLMPAQFVKAFNIRNKSDAADAKAIWLAVQQPCKAVAVKTEMRQAVLMMHRQREQLVKFRTMQINGLRGMLAEFGEAMGKGRFALTKAIADAFIRIEERLPKVLIDSLREQWARIEKLDEEIARIERRLREWKKEDKAVKAISEIPGVGLLTATAAVAMIGDPKAFSSGREFAAWVGLVPKQTGSGGKVNLHGISKRGDAYLRKLVGLATQPVINLMRDALLESAVILADETTGWRDHGYRDDYISKIRATIRLRRVMSGWLQSGHSSTSLSIASPRFLSRRDESWVSHTRKLIPV